MPELPESARLPVSDLLLDPDNPRLAFTEPPSQDDLLRRLYDEESLDELVGSFIENGYFEEEPLVVVRRGDSHVVVEGNRRLATLKLLLNPALRRRVGIDDWPTLTAAQRRRLQEVPVLVYSERAQVIPYLGFRHITGARRWAPFQKARFIAQLVESGYAIDQIQDVVGDETQVVKKLYQEYVVYRQTQELDLPSRPIRQRFSLLEVALAQRPIKRFVGVPHRLPTGPVDVIVPPEREDELVEVISWIFGDGAEEPVIVDSREISSLAKVIADEHALKELRRTRDLDGATEMLEGEHQALMRRLAAAERALRAAAGVLPLYRDDVDVAAAVKRLAALVESLVRQLRKK